MSRFTLKWVDGQYKVSKPGIETMDVINAAEFDEVLDALEALVSDRHYFAPNGNNERFCYRCYKYMTDSVHFKDGESRKSDEDKARALIAKHRGGV